MQFLRTKQQAGWQAVDGDTLAYFRVVFGLVAFYWAAKQHWSGAIDAHYTAPRFHFHYFGFGWVSLLSPTFTRWEFFAMAVAGGLIALGFFYRLSALVFAVFFTHLFLAEKCQYQNHYYLLCLVGLIMTCIPANRCWSVDAWLWRRNTSPPDSYQVPLWIVYLLRFQIGVPYFFGGIAKLNSDWLAGEPIRAMLAARMDTPGVGGWFGEEWCVWLFAGGGLLFDLLIVPLLLYKPTRIAAIALASVFHLVNSQLFTIGVFPWFMLLTLPIYCEPGFVRRILRQGKSVTPNAVAEETSPPSPMISVRWKTVIGGLLLTYVAWQSLMPWRHHVLTTNPNWTEEAHCFSWHMLVRGKRCALRLIATDPTTGRTGTIPLRGFLTPWQLNRVSRDPRLIHELVGYVNGDLQRKGMKNVQIRVLSLVSMNGRKPQHLIDPGVDLVTSSVGWAAPDWITDLQEPLRPSPWDRPLSEWERIIAEDGRQNRKNAAETQPE